MTDFGIDLEQVRTFLRQKEDDRRQRIARRLDPARVYQWGSLVHTERYSEISDIDFALEGSTGPEQYFAALGIAMDETTFRVDIGELEKLDPETADEIITRGRLVYERSRST